MQLNRNSIVIFSIYSDTATCCIFGINSINFVFKMSISSFNLFYSCILTFYQSSVLACVYLQVFYLGVGFFQLAKVYSVSINSACCYIMNLLIAHAYISLVQYNTSSTCTNCKTIGIYSCFASFYAVYSQILLQRYLNIFTGISYVNISSITVEFNFITSFANSHSCLGATICSKFPACIHYLLQLFFCSSIAFSCKVCITNISIM